MNLDDVVSILASSRGGGPVQFAVLGVVALGLGVYYVIRRMKK